MYCHELFPLPGAALRVLIYPTWAGSGEFEREVARTLNLEGVEAAIVDYHGRDAELSTYAGRLAAMQALTADDAQLGRHLRARHDEIRQQMGHAEREAALGYCLGGLCALHTGLFQAELAAVISFHGLLSFPKNRTPRPSDCRFLLLNGGADPMVSSDDLHATAAYFERHALDLTLVNFSRTLHAFSIPGSDDPANGVQYRREAASRSWHYALHCLREAALADAGD